MIHHFLTRQFLRFLAVGVTAALLHWSARFVLSSWLPFGWAVAIAYGVGMLIAFLLNSMFVFPRSDKPRSAQARDFVLVNIAFFPVVWGVALGLDAWFETLGMTSHREDLAHAAAIPLPMLATFLLYKFFAFRERPHG